ncbi:MAG: hypothetical protein L7F78_21285, partial [Syntrophales bacterium LBB04]|nr:hypothetical protein [Syntrophales bacterium LBB04]
SFAQTGPVLTIKSSLENIDRYKGIKVGKPFLVKLEITNNGDRECDIEDYFRVLMKKGSSDWAHFAMAAHGPTNLKAKTISGLMYGSGSGSIAQFAEDKEGLLMGFGGPDVLHDTSAVKMTPELAQWWPAKIASKGNGVIIWPIFWYSNTSDAPLYVASPVFKTNGKRYVYWVSFDVSESRAILLDSKSLLEIIKTGGEAADLRCAAVRWLLETGQDNEKQLVQVVQDAKAPTTLLYRCMQALMVWGSSDAVQQVFDLWKNRKLAPALDDKDTPAYFTWSKFDEAKKYSEKIKTGTR